MSRNKNAPLESACPVPGVNNVSAAAVAVVNDDEHQLKYIGLLLEEMNISPFLYLSPEHALQEMADRDPVNLIITDIHMPRVDGWKFCRLLRSSEYKAYNHIPVLIISATFSGEEPESLARHVGANGFLSWPLGHQDFFSTVQSLLKGENPRVAHRVLIIDDDPVTADLLKHSFSNHGYEAHTANNAQGGIELFNTISFDYAVLDYHLPDKNGNELLELFVKGNGGMVCIMITTDTNPKLALQWMRAGSAGYARKPVDPEYIIALCEKAGRERALIRVEEILEKRSAQVKQLLGEKELLLQEVHHRIKNDMTTIMGLLSLQADSRPNEEARQALLDAEGRVRTMMMIYDILYRSTDYSTVNSSTYFSDLVSTVFDCSNTAGDISLVTEIEDHPLGFKQVFPLGIIVNELVTNAIKYAFKNKPEREMGNKKRLFFSFKKRQRVNLPGKDAADNAGNITKNITGTITGNNGKNRYEPGGFYEIVVSDNGAGLPEPVVSGNSAGFGLQLVSSLTKQLHGKLSIAPAQGRGGTGGTGAEFRLTVPFAEKEIW